MHVYVGACVCACMQVRPGCIEEEKKKAMSADAWAQGGVSQMRTIQMTCMKTCRDAPFMFNGWEESLAWAFCSVDAEWCSAPETRISFAPGIYETASNRYSPVIRATRGANETSEAVDLWRGHQYCFVVTIGQVLPWVFVAIAAIYLLICLLKLPFAVASAGAQLIAQAVSYTHAGS